MVDVNKWGSKLEENYIRLNKENERRQEMLDIMKDVADGHEKNEARKRLDSLTESFLKGNLDTEGFRDAYTDYYTEYEKKDEDKDEDSGLDYL